MAIPKKYADDIAQYKRRVSESSYRRMCKFHDKHRREAAFSEIPDAPSRAGSKYIDHIGLAPIHKEIVPIDPEICEGAQSFTTFLEDQQDIIFNQLKSENSQCDIETKDFVFRMISPHKLPITAIEYDVYDPSITTEDIESDMRKVNRIVSNIIQDGFDNNYPVVSVYADQPFPSLDLYGGHHRLQAVRDLMRMNQLPDTFEVPILIVCPKKENAA